MQCPECKNEVPVSEAQYGALYTCPRCMAVYFVNFEGQAEFGDMTVEPSVESSAAELLPAPIEPPVFENIESPFTLAALEIADYGNQEESISQISYDVLVKGLDTKEVRVAFKEAIEDSKFSWNSDDIMNQIKNGESHLKSLNPIQAFVIAQRIQFLDLDIEWKQNVAF